jgi:hypothetical protein
MSEIVADASRGSEPERDWRAPRFLRLVFEFAFLFGTTFAVQQTFGAALSGYPNLLWVPVALLTLHKGLAVGLVATAVAAGLNFFPGLPPAPLGEDIYAYIRRIAGEPIGWACFALVVGHLRSRQIAHTRELRLQLAERGRHSAAVADLCVDLRRRIEILEREIAANVAHSSNVEVAEAISELNQAGWEDFASRLSRFVTIMTGAPDFSVYLLRDNKLTFAFRPGDTLVRGPDDAIATENALFSAIVNDRRILWAARAADRELLAGRGILAGPLIQRPGDAVIGMLALAGTLPEDDPVDIERRFSIVAAELSRLVGRISLMDKWHHATSNKTNGHGYPNERLQASNLPEPAVAQAELAGASSKTAEENAPVQSSVDSRRAIALQ